MRALQGTVSGRSPGAAALLLCLAAALAAPAARAQADGHAREATGVDEKPRRGNFVETTLGVFTAMGGSRAFSNAQPYLGITLGREVGEQGSVFVSLGIGAASASCYTGVDAAGNCQGADSFGATFAELGGAYGMLLSTRTLLSLKLVAGITNLSPGPVRNGNNVPDNLFGFHGGAGASLDYDTHLDHFGVGLDALVRYSLVPYTPAGGSSQTLGLPTLSVMPRIRYVF